MQLLNENVKTYQMDAALLAQYSYPNHKHVLIKYQLDVYLHFSKSAFILMKNLNTYYCVMRKTMLDKSQVSSLTAEMLRNYVLLRSYVLSISTVKGIYHDNIGFIDLQFKSYYG